MKDPAFLFYSNDFLSGTMLMTDEEIGQYIKLLCLQHQKGHLKEKDMLNICKTYNEEIFSKFVKDEEGKFYNERLEEEIIRRKKYSESRRNNRKKKDLEEKKEATCEEDMKNICNSCEEHMETETTTTTETININNNKQIEENLQKRFVECINSTNLNSIDECISYLKDLPFEVIEIALTKTSDVDGNWKYAKKILNDWVKGKINTVEKVKVEEQKFKKAKENTGQKEETEEEKIQRKIKALQEGIANAIK